jgi:hypothetical protein
MIEFDILPYCRKNEIATIGDGALCRGPGRMRPDSKFATTKPAQLPQ